MNPDPMTKEEEAEQKCYVIERVISHMVRNDSERAAVYTQLSKLCKYHINFFEEA